MPGLVPERDRCQRVLAGVARRAAVRATSAPRETEAADSAHAGGDLGSRRWQWLRRTVVAGILAAAWLAGGGAVPAQQPPAQPPDAETVRLPGQPQSLAEPAVAPCTIPTKNLLQVVRDGGPMMLPLGLSSFL